MDAVHMLQCIPLSFSLEFEEESKNDAAVHGEKLL